MNKRCGLSFEWSLIHPKYWITWIGLGFLFVLSLLPSNLRHALGKKIGTVIYNKNNKRRTTSLINIGIAFPDLAPLEQHALVKKQLQWYGCALVDYSILFFAGKSRLRKLFIIEGKNHIDEAMKKDQSAMLLLAHSNFLEFAPAALGMHFDVFGSYKTSKNPVIDWMIAKSRCRFVKLLVSREQGLRKLVRTIKPGNLMVFLPDEDLGHKNAVFAPFFGKQKSTLTTTARMAKLASAVALPTYTVFDEKRQKYKIKILPPLTDYPSEDAIKDATSMNKAFESLIAEDPAHYMWTMKWYGTRPDGEEATY